MQTEEDLNLNNCLQTEQSLNYCIHMGMICTGVWKWTIFKSFCANRAISESMRGNRGRSECSLARSDFFFGPNEARLESLCANGTRSELLCANEARSEL